MNIMIRHAVIWSCCLLVLGLCGSPSITQAVSHADPVANSYLTITVKSSPTAHFSTALIIEHPRWVDRFRNRSFQRALRTCDLPAAYLTLYADGKTTHYLADEQGYVFDVTGHQLLQVSTETRKLLHSYIHLLSQKHYGEPLMWEEVQSLLPRKAVFDIIDLDTGLRFRAQRRAGSRHADVQPLTYHDTKIMREIYQGKWSWKRRAILVKINNRFIAASMHGMPHGRGALKNGFPGHFCIHFLGSTTHRTKRVDPTHQVMVHKAAGHLADYLDKADPYELVDIFILALNQQDEYLLKQLLPSVLKDDKAAIRNTLTELHYVTKISTLTEEPAHDLLFMQIPVKVQLYWKDRGKETRELIFTLQRHSPVERWSVECDLFSKEN
ncbi:hypothetical protein [Caldalkalibacillus uzonensis]|uniref:hypothetical protein n=1 Tax=Caldalkalibacillus uzonensis TaxID=353224 RepID=UPI003522BC82